MRQTLIELSSYIYLPSIDVKLKCKLIEDNKGSEELAKTPKYRPRTKHIAIKYHHFRQWVKNGIMEIVRVDSEEQQADIFTKPLTIKRHEYLRKQIMGWCCILTQNIEDETKYNNMRLLTCGW